MTEMTKIARAKKFVWDHKTEIVFGIGAGIVLGIVASKVGPFKAPHVDNVIMTNENLQHLIDNVESVISFEVKPKEYIWVTNIASSANQTVL